MPPAEACVAPEESNSDQSSVQSSSESSDISTEWDTAEQNPAPTQAQGVVPREQAFSADTDNQLLEDVHRIAWTLPRAPAGASKKPALLTFLRTVRSISGRVREDATRLRAEIGMRPDGSVRLRTSLKEASNRAQTIINRGRQNHFQEFVATLALKFEQQPLEEEQGRTWTKTCDVDIIFDSYISGFTHIDQKWRVELLNDLWDLRLPDDQLQRLRDEFGDTIRAYILATSHNRETELCESLHIPKNSSLLDLLDEKDVQLIDNDSEGEATHPSDLPSPTYSVTISYNCSHSQDGLVWTKVACPWKCKFTVRKRTIEYSVVSSGPTSPNSLSAIGTSSTWTRA